MKLKIEINTREHFSVLGYSDQAFSVDSRWFAGRCTIRTYDLDELLGTKLRALYQRRKGRDLFDLWLGLSSGRVNPERIVLTLREYLKAEGLSVSRREFRENLAAKLETKSFLSDTANLLRPAITYDPRTAAHMIEKQLLNLL